jgi:hypothetical protein
MAGHRLAGALLTAHPVVSFAVSSKYSHFYRLAQLLPVNRVLHNLRLSTIGELCIIRNVASGTYHYTGAQLGQLITNTWRGPNAQHT